MYFVVDGVETQETVLLKSRIDKVLWLFLQCDL